MPNYIEIDPANEKLVAAVKKKYGPDAKPEDYLADMENRKLAEKPDVIRSTLAGIAHGIVPGIGGLIGGTGGAIVGGGEGLVLGAPTGPGAIATGGIGATAGAITGSLAGSTAAGYLQDKALETFAPSWKDYLDRAHAAHSLTTAGEVAGGLAGGGGGLPAKGLFKLAPSALKATAAGIGANTAVDAGLQMARNKSIDPTKLDLKELGGAAAAGVMSRTPLPGVIKPIQAYVEHVGQNVNTSVRGALRKATTEPSAATPAATPAATEGKKVEGAELMRLANKVSSPKSTPDEKLAALQAIKDGGQDIYYEQLKELYGPKPPAPSAGVRDETINAMVNGTPEAVEALQTPEAKAIADLKRKGINVTPQQVKMVIDNPTEGVQHILNNQGAEVVGKAESDLAAKAAAKATKAPTGGAADEAVGGRKWVSSQLKAADEAKATLVSLKERLDALPETTPKEAATKNRELFHVEDQLKQVQARYADIARTARERGLLGEAKLAVQPIDTGALPRQQGTQVVVDPPTVEVNKVPAGELPEKVPTQEFEMRGPGPSDGKLPVEPPVEPPPTRAPTRAPIAELPYLGEGSMLNKITRELKRKRREEMLKGLTDMPEQPPAPPAPEPEVGQYPERPAPPLYDAKVPVPEGPIPIAEAQRRLLEKRAAEERGKLKAAQAKRDAQAKRTPLPGQPRGMRIDRTAAQKKNNQGGFIDVGAVVDGVRNAGKTVSKWAEEAKATPVFASITDRIRKVNPYLAQKLEYLPIKAQQLIAQHGVPMRDNVFKGLSNDEINQLQDVLYHAHSNGIDVSSTLSPKLQQRLADYKSGLLLMGLDQRANGPYIGGTRPINIDPNWYPTVVDPHVRSLLKVENPTVEVKAKQDALINDFISDYMKANPKAAYIEAFDAMLARSGNKPESGNHNNIEYGPTRRSEGIPLPRSWQMPLEQGTQAYIERWGKDMAYHDLIEKDPQAAVPLGIKQNGRGVDHRTVLAANGLPIQADTRLTELWKNVRANLMNKGSDELRVMNTVWGAAKAGMLGTASQVNDLVMTPASMFPLFKDARDLPMIAQGLGKVLTDYSGSVKRTEQSGGLRLHNPSAPDLTMDVYTKAQGLVRLAHELQGADRVNKIQRAWAQNIGELASKAARAKGDNAFFDEHAPVGWQHMAPDAVDMNVGAKFARLTGAYDYTDLPPWMLQHKQNSLSAGPLRLARWAIGQQNQFNRYVIPEIKKGNFVPLLIGAGVGGGAQEISDLIRDHVLSSKPREMEVNEYLGLNHPDKSKFLYSKIANAIPAGLMSQTAAAMAHATITKNPSDVFGRGGVLGSGPLMSAVQDNAQEVANYVLALMEHPSRFPELTAELADRTTQHNLQFARIVAHMASSVESDSRERRMYDELSGKGVSDVPTGGNPYSPEARFHNAKDASAAAKEVPYMDAQPRERKHVKSNGYYLFLSQIRGKDAARRVYERDAQADVVGEEKKPLVSGLPTAAQRTKEREARMEAELSR